jgi:hypothetical protein
MVRRLAAVQLFVIAVAGTSPASEPVLKRAWEWSAEERIASRTNAELARVRMRPSNAGARGLADRFTGKTHRELFLPYEVFESVVSMGFDGDAQSSQAGRKSFTRELRRHGLPDDFWERLRTLSAVYRADARAVKGLDPSSRADAHALKHAELCRSRADALAAARAELGRERFDRFLYEVIAVKMFYFADRLPEPAVLRKLDGGCR